MLHLLNLEGIEALLLEVPAVVQRLEERDPDYFQEVKSWLARGAETLSNNRLPAAAEIAVCRAELISVDRGFSNGLPLKSRIGARGLKEARASQLLKRATNAITETIRSRRGQVDEASRIMVQIVAAADRLGLIAADSGPSHSAYLTSTLEALSNRAELTSLVVHVTGLLGSTDTLMVLDRSIAAFRQ